MIKRQVLTGQTMKAKKINKGKISFDKTFLVPKTA